MAPLIMAAVGFALAVIGAGMVWGLGGVLLVVGFALMAIGRDDIHHALK